MGTQYYIKCRECEVLHPEDGIKNQKDFLEKVVLHRFDLVDLAISPHDLPNEAIIPSGIQLSYGLYPKIDIDWLIEHKEHILKVVSEYDEE